MWKLPLMVRAAVDADEEEDDGEANNGAADGGDGVGEPAGPILLVGPNDGDANCADKSEADDDTVWWALVGRAAEAEACISGGVDGGEKN